MFEFVFVMLHFNESVDYEFNDEFM